MNTVEERLRAALTAKSEAVSLLDQYIEPEAGGLLLLPAPHQRAWRHWSTVLTAAAAAVILIAVGLTVLAGRGGNTGHPATAGAADVPWSQVGPDWTLMVLSSSGTPDHGLDLVSPAGVHYLICRLPAAFVALQPWTVTGKAILTTEGLERNVSDVLIVDLHTGAQTRTSISSSFATLQFATPGLDSLLVTYPSFMQLVSIDTGQVLVRYPVSNIGGSALSPDDSQVVTGGLGGLTVFDRVSGRRIRTLASPTGYSFCNVTRWVPATNEVLASCFAPGGRKTSTYTFAADGRRAPQPQSVPAGWYELRLATGSVAFQHDPLEVFAPRDVPFARVTAAGQLQPLTLPAKLEAGTWHLAAAVGTDVVLFEEYLEWPLNPTIIQLTAWNPLTGTFTSLIATGPQQPPIVSYRTWQGYSP